MAELSRSAASLRVFGDDLNPDELTRLLGGPPTKAEHKGETVVNKKTGRTRIAPTGSWRRQAERRMPGDLDAQIAEILDDLTDDTEIWQALHARFHADLFCGLFMTEFNEGISLSNATVSKLAVRGLRLEFDIYDGSE